MKTIFISGSVAYDEIMDFPHYFKDYFHPEKLHQINVSFAVSNLAKHLGGCATNIAYGLRNTMEYVGNQNSPSTSSGRAKLKLKEDYIICPVATVGRDGGELLEFFRNNKIDTEFVQQDKKLYTATGKVITDKDDNQIWGYYYGASAQTIQLNQNSPSTSSEQAKLKSKSKRETSHKTLITSPFEEFWIVSATHEKPFSSVLQHVWKNKLSYLFDPGMTLTWINDNLLKKGVMNATYLVGNDYEIAMIEKRLKMSAREIVESGVNVITTLGEQGVKYVGVADSVSRSPSRQYSSPNSEMRAVGTPPTTATCSTLIVKSFKLKKVIDPTGAGDAWRGGFVGALLAGKSIGECLVMGNVMASFAVESVGTVEYQVDQREIEKRIKQLVVQNHK